MASARRPFRPSSVPRRLAIRSFRRIPQAHQAIEQFDSDLLAVFDSYSGDTHFLNELPYLILKSMDGQPRTLQEIAARLSDGADLKAEAINQIEQALASLELSHLVESCDR